MGRSRSCLRAALRRALRHRRGAELVFRSVERAESVSVILPWGSQEKYFELYKITAQTIKAVDPKLRVGGPATSNFDMDEAAVQNAQAMGKTFDPFSIPWVPV